MKLPNLISLERVKIVKETPDVYIVKCGNNEFQIAKDSDSHFSLGSSSPQIELGLSLNLEQRIIPETGIFQDESAPIEFKEIMMFHEIREKEYAESGVEDAHQRAVNDEILYTLKFFDKKTQEKYFKFAEEYREQKRERMYPHDNNKFFGRKANEVAIDLLGLHIFRKDADVAKIIETGAYEGGKETQSRQGMLYAPGTIFLMPFRGSQLLNIATDREGYPSCVEIREINSYSGDNSELISGSGKITNYLKLNNFNGIVVGGDFQIGAQSILSRNSIRKIKEGSNNCLGYYSIK